MDRDIDASRNLILATVASYHAAMVAADTAALGLLVAPDFFLVHVTGYRQPRDEWFGVIRSSAFDYHAIQANAADMVVDILSDHRHAVVKGAGTFDATINTMHAPWQLQFTLNLGLVKGQWVLDAHYRMR